MENNEKKKSMLKIITIFLILVVIIGFAGFAFARYVTMLNGRTSVDIAKWSFKVTYGETKTQQVPNFATTRTDNNQDVQAGTLAPGTKGKFQINVDASGTETDLLYNISLKMTGKPTNLKFYTDEGLTQEYLIENNTLEINQALNYNNTRNKISIKFLYKA